MSESGARYRRSLVSGASMRTYKAYHDLLASKRWQKLAASGARPQRLLWGSTGTKDPAAADTLYIDALAAPDTINTISEQTLFAFADHGKVTSVLPVDEGYAEAVIAEFCSVGHSHIDDDTYVLTESNCAELRHQILLLCGRIQAQKADCLALATAYQG